MYQSSPESVLFEIAIHLNYSELMKYCRVSKRFAQICNNPFFWQQKGRLDFPMGKFKDIQEDLTQKLEEILISPIYMFHLIDRYKDYVNELKNEQIAQFKSLSPHDQRFILSTNEQHRRLKELYRQLKKTNI